MSKTKRVQKQEKKSLAIQKKGGRKSQKSDAKKKRRTFKKRGAGILRYIDNTINKALGSDKYIDEYGQVSNTRMPEIDSLIRELAIIVFNGNDNNNNNDEKINEMKKILQKLEKLITSLIARLEIVYGYGKHRNYSEDEAYKIKTNIRNKLANLYNSMQEQGYPQDVLDKLHSIVSLLY